MAIVERKDRHGKKRFMVRIDVRDPVTGARERVTVGTFGAKREAQREEAKAITLREQGTLLRPDSTTVSELLDEYVRVELPKTVRPENRGPYVSVIAKHLKPALGNVQVRKLTVQHVERLLAHMQGGGLSSSAITKARMRLSSALKMAVRYGIVATNVAEVAKPPKITTKDSRIWTPEEVGRFLQVAREHRLAPFWLLAIETGARQSELLGLTWEDVNFDAMTLRLGRQAVRLLDGRPVLKQGGKSKAAGRTIRLTPGTIKALRNYRKEWLAQRLAGGPDWNSHGVIFTTRTGGLINANNLRVRDFAQLVDAAGVPAIVLHEVRKTSVTLALANGASPKAVAARVGHADTRTTMDVYANITASMDDALLEVMSAIVAPRGATDRIG